MGGLIGGVPVTAALSSLPISTMTFRGEFEGVQPGQRGECQRCNRGQGGEPEGEDAKRPPVFFTPGSADASRIPVPGKQPEPGEAALERGAQQEGVCGSAAGRAQRCALDPTAVAVLALCPGSGHCALTSERQQMLAANEPHAGLRAALEGPALSHRAPDTAGARYNGQRTRDQSSLWLASPTRDLSAIFHSADEP